MRTARSLTLSPSMFCIGGCTWSRGVYLVAGGYLVKGGCTWSKGVPGPGGVTVRGVLGPGGCTWSGGVPGLGGCLWSGGCTWSRGVPGLGGAPGPGVHLVQGVHLVLGGVPGPRGRGYLVQGEGVPGPGGLPGLVLPPVDRITDACKNITLPQLRCGR